MSNGDESMSPAEFAKLMGAYPEPANNPLPAYGGYMDNSPANFAWVQNNDYFGAEEGHKTLHEKGDYRIIAVEDYDISTSVHFQEREDFDDLMELSHTYGMFTISLQKKVMGGWKTIDAVSGVVPHYGGMEEVALMELGIPNGIVDVETFEAPYGGAGSLMDIGKETPLADFTGQELAESSAIHGDFDQASLNYSGHQNLEVRAEMNELTDSVVDVSNRFGESVGMIEVEDYEDVDRIEDVEITVSDKDGMKVVNTSLEDFYTPDDEDDYDFDTYESPKMMVQKNTGWIALASVALGTLAYFNRDTLTSSVKKVFNNETQEMLENDPELIENPNTGNLDPAQYEELVVQSTGYAVDVIPIGLDGSFMGSRFAALPTERYVEYNDPGIGAHTDIALNRDEMYLEPEMAMVQASENVIKEAQAPGQSPYNSITGEENPDFDYRVLKETHPVSLDPAVKPFIPQSMTGYTGNANTPPSVMNKMFNIGVLGQTPAFVPGSSDMGASHFGSRNATPNTLGLGGSVGGPLSDQVNASYTDGTNSMSLAQWAIENTVSQTSDTEAVVIDRSSGLMKRVRRV